MENKFNNRAVITGIGTISSLGRNVSETIDSLEKNRVNFKEVPITRFPTNNKVLRTKRIFQIPEEDYLGYKDKDLSVLGIVTCLCIEQAMHSAHVSRGDFAHARTSFSFGMSVSTTFVREKVVFDRVMKHQQDWELIKYSTPRMICDMVKDFGVNGVVSVTSTACASGTTSIGRACDLIRNGRADFVICGGIDIVSQLAFNGFNSLLALSHHQCEPFGLNRDGMSLGDGCAMFVLESYESALRRHADIYAEVPGYYILNEAYHPTSPHPDGIYAYRCMKEALRDSGLTVDAIDYINAHGTGTKMNDGAEFKAIDRLAEEKAEPICFNSTKGMTGHTLGAAGSLEALVCILSMQNNSLYGDGRNYDALSSPKSIYVNRNKPNTTVRTCLSNSFAFAGNMASIVLKKL